MALSLVAAVMLATAPSAQTEGQPAPAPRAFNPRTMFAGAVCAIAVPDIAASTPATAEPARIIRRSAGC